MSWNVTEALTPTPDWCSASRLQYIEPRMTPRIALQHWYAVMCKPRAEVVARACLQRQGFEVFLPQHQRSLRTAQGMRTRIEALFPRYLFVHLDPDQHSIGPIRSTRGVSHLVNFGNGPVIVPDQVIATIRARQNAENGLVELRAPALVEGSTVRVTQGPLMGLEGLLLQNDGNDRVRVLLTVLGAERNVELGLDALRASL